MEVLRNAVEFKRTTESSTEFFMKTRRMAEEIMSFQWTLEEIEKCLLLHCNNDDETQKEITLRDVKEKEEIQKIIKKMDEVKMERKQINSVKMSYVNVMKRNSGSDDKTFQVKRTNGDQRTCWNCRKVGHIIRQCQKQRDITCFGCGRKGHIRRECRIKCSKCEKTGHYAEECYSKRRNEIYTEVRRVGRTGRDEERSRRWTNSDRSPRMWEASGRSRQFTNEHNNGRTNGRQLAILQEDDEEGRSIQESDDYYRGIERGRLLAAQDERDRDYERKNENRQVVEEPILAME